MYDYNKKKKKSIFEGLRNPNPDGILEEKRFKFEEDDKKETSDSLKDNKVDYLKKNPPLRAYYGFFCALIGFTFSIASAVIIYRQSINVELIASVIALCGVIWSVAGVVYAILGFREKNKNYTLSYIVLVIAGIQMVFWSIVAILGQGL